MRSLTKYRRSGELGALALAVLIAGCSSAGSGSRASFIPQMGMPRSVSPGLIEAAPMAKTALLPASAMRSPIRPTSAIQGANWAEIPGSANSVAVAPDGSLWALSTAPSGPDKYIWHYASGAWNNISGLAAHIAIAPNGTLYAVNSGGGAYAYSNGNWTALGGGASGITVASDGSIYVLSNGNTAGSDQAIWHNVSGSWSQVPGSGVALGASWDTGGPYAGSSGTIRAGGFYILNSAGAIWYENTDGTFAQLPGSASAIAPTNNGGVFALGYPASSSGSSIYYDDLNSSQWNVQSGAAVSIATNSVSLYAIGAAGAIYATATLPQAKIYVAGFSSVTAYAAGVNGNATPLTTISGGNTGLSAPRDVTLDGVGQIYVANLTGGPSGNGSITVYSAGANGNSTPTQTIAAASSGSDLTGLSGPLGVAVDAAGKIYVTNHSSSGYSLTVYAAGANGNAAPVASVSGANTGLDYPTGVALDANDNIYVANYYNNSVTVYAAKASNGNVAPQASIIGSSTGLAGPWGIALDASGNIYVANIESNTITVYPANASGNVVPTATISGTTGPTGIALDASGNMYVSNNSHNTVSTYPAGASGNATPTAIISGASTGLNLPGGLIVH